MMTVGVSNCGRFTKQLIQTATDLPYTVQVFDADRRACIDDRALAPLSTVKSLRWLALGLTNVGTDGLPFVAEMTELEFLDLTATKIDQRALQTIARLPNIRSLKVRYTRIASDDLAVFAGHPKLERLDMSGVSIQSGCVDHLLAIPNLREVYLDRDYLPDDESARLDRELDKRQQQFDRETKGSVP